MQKKRNEKRSPLVDSPASVTEQMTSVEVQGLQVEKKRLLAQLRLLEKKTKKLEEELLLEQIRSEGYLMMLELEQDDKEKHKRKKTTPSSQCNVHKVPRTDCRLSNLCTIWCE